MKMNENANIENGKAVGGRLEGLVVRLRALGALALMLTLFWLPLWFALRETLGIAWRWAKDDVSHEYAEWARAIVCAAKALITGHKCDA
jgi:hypothetical protein